jgi:hypothetical protein
MEAGMAEPLITDELYAHRGRSRRPRPALRPVDLGLGEPELAYVSLAEIRSVLGPLRLPTAAVEAMPSLCCAYAGRLRFVCTNPRPRTGSSHLD